MSSRTPFILTSMLLLTSLGCQSEPLNPPTTVSATFDTFLRVEGTVWVYRLSDAPGTLPTTACLELVSAYNGELGHPVDAWQVSVEQDEPRVFKGLSNLHEDVIGFNQVVLFPGMFELRFPLVEGKSWDSGWGEATVAGRSRVTVPMGVFEDAVHMVAEGYDPYEEAPYTLELWFVPNVGFVKIAWDLSRQRFAPPHRLWELVELRAP